MPAIDSALAGDLLIADTLLCRLYAGDTGDDTPNPANRFALRAAEMGDFGAIVASVGRPYVWAQELCGLRFLAEGLAEGGGQQKGPQASLSADRMQVNIDMRCCNRNTAALNTL